MLKNGQEKARVIQKEQGILGRLYIPNQMTQDHLSVEHYHRNSFILVPNAVDPRLCEELLQEFRTKLSPRKFTDVIYQQASLDPGLVARTKEAIQSPSILYWLGELGLTDPRLLVAQYIRSTEGLACHSDAHYDKTYIVNAWISLARTDARLCIHQGSHILDQVPSICAQEYGDYADRMSHNFPEIWLDVPVGGAVIFNSKALHKSNRTPTPIPRETLAPRYG